ncbi:MAG TPA: alpha/beta hydrolase, partial [Steroidobacteraceae bacterium]|nr:alpha/beta hydrolase [Steroidobacteraceae bacterium]
GEFRLRLIAAALLALLAATAHAAPPEPTKILVNGVELHYISAGTGEALILLHGGQGDYRSWEPQIAELSRYYRVISYSRRYNFPNQNPPTATDFSVNTEAADLAALIKALKLKRVNLVGTSMGAATALTMAVENPRLVRSLVLAEPPLLAWARHFPEGPALYDDFMKRIQDPAREAFAAGNDEAAMRLFVDGFAKPGRFDGLPAEARAGIMQNAGFFRMMSRSENPYPEIDRRALWSLRLPVLVITGEKTIEIHRRIDEELTKAIPRARSASIPNAGHGSPRENPNAFTQVVKNFLETSGK